LDPTEPRIAANTDSTVESNTAWFVGFNIFGLGTLFNILRILDPIEIVLKFLSVNTL